MVDMQRQAKKPATRCEVGANLGCDAGAELAWHLGVSYWLKAG